MDYLVAAEVAGVIILFIMIDRIKFRGYGDHTVSSVFLKEIKRKSGFYGFVNISKLDQDRPLRGRDLYYIYLSAQPRLVLRYHDKALIFLSETIGAKVGVHELLAWKDENRPPNTEGRISFGYQVPIDKQCAANKLLRPSDMESMWDSSRYIMNSEYVPLSKVLEVTKNIREYEAEEEEKRVERERLEKEREDYLKKTEIAQRKRDIAIKEREKQVEISYKGLL